MITTVILYYIQIVLKIKCKLKSFLYTFSQYIKGSFLKDWQSWYFSSKVKIIEMH